MPDATPQVVLTRSGYLHLAAELVRRHFPQAVLVALPRGDELWLLPTRGPAAGGLLVKQRNAAGDGSVLVAELLPPGMAAGPLDCRWDSDHGALRLRAPAGPGAHP
jgi:hypothetical protein